MKSSTDHNDVVITGFGLVTSVGVEPSSIWDSVSSIGTFDRFYDRETFAPFIVHSAGKYDASSVIKTRTHLRSMGEFQQNAAYAAGTALLSAGLNDRRDILERTALIVACNDGQRDRDIDELVLASGVSEDRIGETLNRYLLGMRPTMFLCQLPNLFSANISLAFGVTGSSVTFMGDQHAGVSAVETAFRKISTGQEDIMLVGGSFGVHYQQMLAYAGTSLLLRGTYKNVWERGEDFLALGTAAAFLVLESSEHARQRGAVPKAKISSIQASYKPRDRFDTVAETETQLAQCVNHLRNRRVITDTCNTIDVRNRERRLWEQNGFTVRNTANVFGSIMQASLPVNLALATMCLEKGRFLPPLCMQEQSAVDSGNSDSIDQILINCRGLYRGEALAIIETNHEE